MNKSYKKQTVKYVILLEKEPMTLEEIKKIENALANEARQEKENQFCFLLDLILKY